MLTLHLKPRRHERIAGGHCWAFAGEIAEDLKGVEPGEAVALCESRGALLGRGYVNPHSLIAVRLLTRGEEPLDDGLFRRRIAAAVEYRRRYCPDWEAHRVIHSESDGLPGLIVDRYGSHLVVMSLTAGIERRLDEITPALVEQTGATSVFLRGSSPHRALEGLPQEDRILWGTPPDRVEFQEGDLSFTAYPLHGQKTGFFLDQRANRATLRRWAVGARVLDLYAYTGAWGMSALAGGARGAVMVDSSAAAIDWGRDDAERNDFARNSLFVEADAPAFLDETIRRGEKYDVVVLDPPALIPSRAALEKGSALYERLNRLAMQAVAPGGMLVTCSCSHLMDRERHLALIGKAAIEAGRKIRLAAAGGPPPDHPALPGHPESDYLKCWFVEVGKLASLKD